MRIAIVNSNRVYGGQEKWALRAAAGMRSRGHCVTIFCPPGSDLVEHCQEEDVPCSPVPLRRGIARSGVSGLARALRRARAEVVICCNERETRLAVFAVRLAVAGTGYPLGGRRPPPLIYSIGGRGGFKDRVYNRLMVAPFVARFVVCAEAVRLELLGRKWIPPHRLRLIYNGVDPSSIDQADPTGVRQKLGAAREEVVFLVSSRLDDYKGHAMLVNAVAGMKVGEPRWQFWLAGDGPEATHLRAQVEALGLQERVRLLGFRRDIPRLLRAADVLCHPSRREGAPHAVLEGMAAGLPVVAVAADGTPELVGDGQTGLLSPVGDEASLRRNLETVLGDPDLRCRLGRAGRERARIEFSEPRSIERWVELVEEVRTEG